MTVPGRMCVVIRRWTSVSLVRSGTRKSSTFCDPRSITPNTHGPSETLPLLYFLVAPNFDTVFPKPPSLIPAFRTLLEIHRRYAAVLSTLNEKKCSLNNAYRLAGTARSTIRDFLGIAELKIVNEVTYQSTLERLGDPKLSVKRIEQECRRQLGGLLPLVKRLRVAKKLLPLALEDAFYS